MPATSPTTARAFPLSRVAVVGSRHGSPYRPGQLAGYVVRAGGQVVTGCARGVDSAAAAAAGAAMQQVHASSSALHVIHAASRQPRDLATRTRQVVAAAVAVAVFPPAGGAAALGPGSLLALGLAQRSRLPVFVAGPTAPTTGSGWQPGTVAGVAGWLWFPAPAPAPMPSLF